MKCPACTKPLKELKVDNLTVDVCQNGCGGIWFDAFELQRVDEAHEVVGARLASAVAERSMMTPPPDQDAKRECPRCAGVKLKKHLFRPQSKVRVDQCPNCGGFWLDHGELEAIRAESRLAAMDADRPGVMTMETIRFLYRLRTRGQDSGSTSRHP